MIQEPAIQRPDAAANPAARGQLALKEPVTSELLILPNGTILVHNLTPVFAMLLRDLSPDDELLRLRAGDASVRNGPSPP